MLIRFSIENWMSFRDPVTFSMIASKERQHGNRVPKLGKYRTRILPITAIYGGNASGKTNFFKALHFVRKIIVRGTEPDSDIAVKNFLLDDVKVEQPTRFALEILVDKTIYEFAFSVNHKQVLEEKLTKIFSNREQTLYTRSCGKIKYDKSLTEQGRLKFTFESTRNNQLFLTSTVLLNLQHFKPVYDWFAKHLVLIAPDSRFGPFDKFMNESGSLHNTMNDMLPQLDTGIARLGEKPIALEEMHLSEPFKQLFQEEVLDKIQEGETIRVRLWKNKRCLITCQNKQLSVRELVANHRKADGTEVSFDIDQESDGSQRVLDLLPAFFALTASNAKKVFVIDEIDRSLHTLLTRRLLEAYLANCSDKTRSQLLLTTHDVFLMDQHLLRRDEIWVAERKHSGSSMLIPFSDYKDIRYDKDIKKSYLQGRLRGIPHILMGNHFVNSQAVEEIA